MSSDEIKETATAAYHATAAESEIRALADELYRERVLEVRRMPPEEKLLAGEELFDYACSITLAGIRNQFPSARDGVSVTAPFLWWRESCIPFPPSNIDRYVLF